MTVLTEEHMAERVNSFTGCNKHDLIFIENVYGKETETSLWQCTLCGKQKYKPYFNKTGIRVDI